MMSCRLSLAKILFSLDGAILASCNEGDHPRWRVILDEIFAQTNFIADMIWAAGRKNDSRLISISHEYIVCYAKDANNLKEKGIVWRQRKKGLDEIYSQHARLTKQFKDDYASMTQHLKAWYRDLPDGHPSKAHKHYSHVDFRGVYFPDKVSWPGGGGPKYEVLHPKTLKPVKVPSRGWMTSDPKKLNDWIADQRVHFGDDENSVPCIKSYLKDRELQTPYSVFYQDGRAASKRLRSLMGGDYFEFPKDELVLQEIIAMVTSGNDLILDLFAGSGTTAHSVIRQNAEDGGNRMFLMVQLPEQTDEKSEAFKAGYKTIADVGKERIRRAGTKIKEEAGLNGGHLDIGFRVFKIDTSNMKEVYYSPDEQAQGDLLGQIGNIKEDRTSEDLVFSVLLDWGVDIALPIRREVIKSKEVFFVDQNALAACFDVGLNEDFVKELARRKPLRAVFRDASFGSDDVKINVGQIFKLISPETEVRSI